jgi:molybdopterin converting factor small subunit
MTEDNSYWFHKKWGIGEKSLEERISQLGKTVLELREKYQGALEDIKRLEEENIETTNVLYELMENMRAIDARIDIIAEHCRIDYDV